MTMVGPSLDSDATCGTTLTASDLKIGTLDQDTFSHPLLLGSPAIVGADAAIINSNPILQIDQAGNARPVMGASDLGPVESGTGIFADRLESGDTSKWSNVVL